MSKTSYRVRCPKCGAGPDFITREWREDRCGTGLHVWVDSDGVPQICNGDIEYVGSTREYLICGRCGKKSFSDRVFIDVALEEVDA